MVDYIYTKNASSALNLILSKMNNNSIKILLPAYIGYSDREGSGVFDPIIQNKCDFFFYSIDMEFQPNIVELEKIFKNNDIKYLLLIYFLGLKIKDIKKIVSLCNIYNVEIIEDCAHIMNNIKNKSCGFYGKYSFYSLHKSHYFLNDGGILRSNYQYFNEKESSKFKKNKINYTYYSKKRNLLYEIYYKNLKKIRQIKINFSKKSFISPPYNFPIFLKYDREKLYFYLKKNKIWTYAIYNKIIPQINLNKFLNSKIISEQILNLPIEENMTKNDVLKTCFYIKEYFKIL